MSAWEGNNEVFVRGRGPGGSLRRLTFHPADDRSPSWSPDGRLIACVGERDGRPSVALMQLSGETVAWLSVSDSYAEHEPPAWAPDGGRLAFLYRPIWRLGGPSPIEWEEIYTANADGTRGRPISTAWSYLDLLSMRSPAWSPGGEFLVFASDMLDGQLRVYLLDAELAIQLAN